MKMAGNRGENGVTMPFEQLQVGADGGKKGVPAPVACQVSLDESDAVAEIRPDFCAQGVSQQLVAEADAQAGPVTCQPGADRLFFPAQEGILFFLVNVGAAAENNQSVVKS